MQSNAPAAENEQCPPPLVWHEVLGEFREQALAWNIERAGRIFSGRTLGQGRPLYFLGGLTGTHELFCLLAWLLRDAFRCVLIDYAGSGAFERAAGASTLDDLVADVAAIRAYHADEQVDLFATSLGSLIALSAMLAEPNCINRAILQAGYARRRLSMAERILIRLGGTCPGRLRQAPGRDAIARNNHRRWFPPFDETRWNFFLDDTGRVPLKSLAARAAIVRDEDLRPRLHELNQRVLLISTEGEGAVSRALGEELAAAIPHATREHLNNTGPAPFLTHPHRVASAIRKFLT